MPVANRPEQEARRSKKDGARASLGAGGEGAKGRVEALAEDVDEELLLRADSAIRGGGRTQLQTTSSRKAFAMPSPTPASSPPSAEKKRT